MISLDPRCFNDNFESIEKHVKTQSDENNKQPQPPK